MILDLQTMNKFRTLAVVAANGRLSDKGQKELGKMCAGLLADWERRGEALLRRGVSAAPCDICGHNGPNYHQPESHRCIGDADRLRKMDRLREARAALEGKP